MIRVFLADDHALFRDGLRHILDHTPSLQVVGEAGDGQVALEKLGTTSCDVLLLDLNMPGLGGIDVLRKLRATHPTLAILVVGEGDQVPPHEKLSQRGHQVFMRLTEGRSPSEIAVELSLSPSTVSTYIARIKKQLGAQTIGEIVRYASRTGLL